jgi:hypothetical protein
MAQFFLTKITESFCFVLWIITSIAAYLTFNIFKIYNLVYCCVVCQYFGSSWVIIFVLTVKIFKLYVKTVYMIGANFKKKSSDAFLII